MCIETLLSDQIYLQPLQFTQESYKFLLYRANYVVYFMQIVDQESLKAVEEIKTPVVFCVAAWFGKVRLIDNIEINL